MLDTLLETGTSMWDSARPHFEPADPTQGSQGASRGGERDGSFFGDLGQTFGDLGRGFLQEGLIGLLDPSGMLDRQDAQRDLASRFNVMPDGAVGTTEQNQVSEEEFQRIARTYSDIRTGRGDLTLGARPDDMSEADYATFRDNAMNDVADILQTESGRGLVGSLADAPLQADGVSNRATTIHPRLDETGALDPSNAGGGGMIGQSGSADYVPGVDTFGTLRSDVTLYHELTHAHHAVYNTWDAGQVGGADPNNPDLGISQSEHQAAGLGLHANNPFSENRYRGERRRIGELNVGERNHGYESDDVMTHRDQYMTPLNPDGTERIRTTPAFIPPVSTVSTGNSSASSRTASGNASRIGQSTDEHDHHH